MTLWGSGYLGGHPNWGIKVRQMGPLLCQRVEGGAVAFHCFLGAWASCLHWEG